LQPRIFLVPNILDSRGRARTSLFSRAPEDPEPKLRRAAVPALRASMRPSATQLGNVGHDILKLIRLLPSSYAPETIGNGIGAVASREDKGFSDTHEFVHDWRGRVSPQVKIDHGDIKTIGLDGHRLGEFGDRTDHLGTMRPKRLRQVLSE